MDGTLFNEDDGIEYTFMYHILNAELSAMQREEM